MRHPVYQAKAACSGRVERGSGGWGGTVGGTKEGSMPIGSHPVKGADKNNCVTSFIYSILRCLFERAHLHLV